MYQQLFGPIRLQGRWQRGSGADGSRWIIYVKLAEIHTQIEKELRLRLSEHKKVNGEIKGWLKPHTHSPSVSKICQQGPFLIILHTLENNTRYAFICYWGLFQHFRFQKRALPGTSVCCSKTNNTLLFFPLPTLSHFL